MDALLLRLVCGCDSVARTNDSLPCGGPAKGQCVCGKCECNPVLVTGDTSKRYRGKYCQCNDYSCDHYEKMICGGRCSVFVLASFLCCIGQVAALSLLLLYCQCYDYSCSVHLIIDAFYALVCLFNQQSFGTLKY